MVPGLYHRIGTTAGATDFSRYKLPYQRKDDIKYGLIIQTEDTSFRLNYHSIYSIFRQIYSDKYFKIKMYNLL
jgi:hypothetical protein